MSDNRASVAKLTRVDKAAVLLLSLGETDAAQVLRHMGPKEVQRVGVAMAQMRNVHREQVEQVMSEFVDIVGDQTSLGVGSDGYIRKMLTQALGEDKANGLIDRILLGGNTSGLDGELANDRVSLGGPQSILLPSPSEGYDAQLNAIKSLVAEDPGRVAQVVKEWINADE